MFVPRRNVVESRSIEGTSGRMAVGRRRSRAWIDGVPESPRTFPAGAKRRWGLLCVPQAMIILGDSAGDRP